MSSLLPLLAEYSLHPPVPDAQSIVSNVKVGLWWDEFSHIWNIHFCVPMDLGST